jgi:hypothetical protein
MKYFSKIFQGYVSPYHRPTNKNVLLVRNIGVNHLKQQKIVVHYVIVPIQFGVMMKNRQKSIHPQHVNGVKRFSKILIKAFNI